MHIVKVYKQRENGKSELHAIHKYEHKEEAVNAAFALRSHPMFRFKTTVETIGTEKTEHKRSDITQ